MKEEKGFLVESELLELRREIEELRWQQRLVHAELLELQQLVRERWLCSSDVKPSCSTSPLLTAGPSVLILGDGNLSFSLAFSRVFPEIKLVASVVEDEQSFIVRYPSGRPILDELYKLFPNVHVKFCIDACNLPPTWEGKFHDIIWNFPHSGGKTNLRKSRELLRSSLKSLSRIVSGNRFHITLAKGQSGLDHEAVKRREFLRFGPPSHRKDSWQLAYIAAECGFIIENVCVFDPDIFPSYKSSGYRGTDRMFHNRRGAETITLTRSSDVISLDELKKNENEYVYKKLPGIYHELRPFFLHDLSIVYIDPGNISQWEEVFFRLLREICGLLLSDICEVKQLRSLAPNGFPNRIYRVTWQSWKVPLYKSLCNSLQEDLRNCISQSILVNEMKFVLT